MKKLEGNVINQNHPKIRKMVRRSPNYFKILQVIAFCVHGKPKTIDWNNGQHTYHLEAGEGLMLAPDDYPFYVTRKQIENALNALKRTYKLLETNYKPMIKGRSVVTFTDPTIFEFN